MFCNKVAKMTQIRNDTPKDAFCLRVSFCSYQEAATELRRPVEK